MLDPAAIPEIARFVLPEDFYLASCREIFRAASELDGAGRNVSLESVAAWLQERGRLAGIGGLATLGDVVDATPAMASAHDYARTVAERAAVRRTGEACGRVAAEASAQVEDAPGWLQDVATRVAEVTDLGRLSERDPAATACVVASEVHVSVLQRVERARAGLDGSPGLSTGFRDLDHRIGRLAYGSLTIIGAPTGIGKTGLALRIARNVARAGLSDRESGGAGWGVAYATLEIPRDELLERALADVSHVECDALFAGTIKDRDHAAITAALADLGRLPLVIDDGNAHSLATLRGLVRRASAKLGVKVKLLVVDYLQLVRAMARRGASTEEQVAEVSKGLRAIAGDLGIAVLATSQFNRDYRSRADKEPQVTDLRHSGQIEQDARAIVLLQRVTADDEEPQIIHAFTRKARGGGHPGTGAFVYRKRTATWAELARDDGENRSTDPPFRSGSWSPDRNAPPPPRDPREQPERDDGPGPDDYGIPDQLDDPYPGLPL